ncbi:MAG: 5'/3'-nucleotidase SurE [Pseudomonadota bacterium]
MKILLSNDDGYTAPGIQCLAEVLADIVDITVIAPDRNCSGASNSLTLDRPLRITQMADSHYMVNGTPTDCVHLALTGALDVQPDMVISGINRGYNLGDDIMYSGTVAGAMEGRYLGFPALAVSLGSPAEHYQAAAAIVKEMVTLMREKPLPSDTILNINVPDLPLSKIEGIEVTYFGRRHASEPTIKVEDPRGGELYWIGLPGDARDINEGSDFFAVRSNRVSVTPFRMDWTDYDGFDRLHDWIDTIK